jgi:AAA family ATP:ADP antiporter
MLTALGKTFDLREGETPVLLKAFGSLFLLIAGHTILETARDALFLSKLPPDRLNVVYVVLAAVSWVVVRWMTKFSLRFGRRNAFVCGLLAVAYGTVLLHHLAPRSSTVLVLYVFSGLVGSVLTAQFWTLVASMFTVAQGRRLFGLIASGGVVGGFVGATSAAGLLSVAPVTTLLPVAAGSFVVAALIATTIHVDSGPAVPHAIPGMDAPPHEERSMGIARFFRDTPFLMRIAVLLALSTAAVLVVDYLFKSTAARVIPPEKLGGFFAQYYAVINAISFVVQIFIAGRLVKRLGVAATVGVMPLLLFGGGLMSLLTGGVLLAVLGTKAVDGSLRYSLNRVATELLYLPVPADARDRAKTLLDTVLVRVVQAVTAIAVFALSMTGHASPRVLSAMVVVLSLGWLIAAIGVRRPYLGLFRRALSEGTFANVAAHSGVEELDLGAAETVVEMLASREPLQVIAAMNLLEQRKRVRLITALVLYHESDEVLLRALEIFGASDRTDWIPLAERLLVHPHEPVRVAAVRVLARRSVDALRRAGDDYSTAVQAHAAYHLALRDDEEPVEDHPRIAVLLSAPGMDGEAGRLALLQAIADTPDPRAIGVLQRFSARAAKPPAQGGMSLEMVYQFARAIAAIKDPSFIPVLIARLAMRDGRDSIRDALAALEEPALDALTEALKDPNTPRRVRLHIPRTIGRFGTQRATDVLTDALHSEEEGLVRYKLLRGLGLLVSLHDVKVDRVLIEERARQNLLEHLRLLILRVVGVDEPLDNSGVTSSSRLLLTELLQDKGRQALERAFRYLQIAYRLEDIHRVYDAAISKDRRERANAAEFVDTLLARRDQQELRALFRIVIDDLDDKNRAERAREWVKTAPATRADALTLLVEDPDAALAAIAVSYASSMDDSVIRARVARARAERPSLDAVTVRFFGQPAVLSRSS